MQVPPAPNARREQNKQVVLGLLGALSFLEMKDRYGLQRFKNALVNAQQKSPANVQQRIQGILQRTPSTRATSKHLLSNTNQAKIRTAYLNARTSLILPNSDPKLQRTLSTVRTVYNSGIPLNPSIPQDVLMRLENPALQAAYNARMANQARRNGDSLRRRMGPTSDPAV